MNRIEQVFLTVALIGLGIFGVGMFTAAIYSGDFFTHLVTDYANPTATAVAQASQDVTTSFTGFILVIAGLIITLIGSAGLVFLPERRVV